MKNIILIAIAILTFVCPTFAQFTTVTYDLQRNWFNEGQALPAEKSMVFKGMIPSDIELVELSIRSAKKDHQLYQATWVKTNTPELSLNIPFKLRSSEEYDFTLHFFEAMSSSEHQALEKKITTIFDTYVDVNLSGAKSIKFVTNKKKVLKEMNTMISNQLIDYRSKKGNWVLQFSKMVELKIAQLEKTDLDQNYVKKDSTKTRQQIRNQTRQQLVNDLKSQLRTEVRNLLDTDLYTLKDSRFVDNYATETKENSLALNFGYGGVYLSGDWEDFTYGASPYLGVAFPLGNRVLGSKFLSNTSVTLGVFTQNFTDKNDNEVTGFIVDRPIYLGLDHKLFKFIRINAGAAFLEGLNVSDIPGIDPTKNIMVRPYVGLSARIDLSIGFGK